MSNSESKKKVSRIRQNRGGNKKKVKVVMARIGKKGQKVACGMCQKVT